MTNPPLFGSLYYPRCRHRLRGFQQTTSQATELRDAAYIKAVGDALEAYRGSETESESAYSDLMGDTTSRDKLRKTINTRRSATQHAADAIWPYTDEANAGHRKAFELPQSL